MLFLVIISDNVAASILLFFFFFCTFCRCLSSSLYIIISIVNVVLKGKVNQHVLDIKRLSPNMSVLWSPSSLYHNSFYGKRVSSASITLRDLITSFMVKASKTSQTTRRGLIL